MGKEQRQVEEMWNHFKNIVCEIIERFVPQKHLEKIRTPNIRTRRLSDLNQRSEKNTIEEN